MQLLDPADLMQSEQSSSSWTQGRGYTQSTSMVTSGQGSLSLRDIISEPELAFTQVTANARANGMAAVFQTLGIAASFRIGKRVLRRPIANINRNIFTPILGKGVLRL